jgi:hypothetical protein
MDLNREQHPVGTKFLGHRWNYSIVRRSRGGDDDSPSDRPYEMLRTPSNDRLTPDGPAVYSDLFDPNDVPAILVQRFPADGLESVAVLEYSPSGAFVKVKAASGTSPAGFQTTADLESSEHGGYWTRTSRLNILELLP